MPEKYRQLQQGDILLQEAASIPEGSMQTSDRSRIVLARGERTGHSYVPSGPGSQGALFCRPFCWLSRRDVLRNLRRSRESKET